ncbi:MAG TPA: protein kinase [Terriglobales bacterium]|jgi:serine/threonine protein kinase|nr:protein kinase [Terriglobales bacterium]
MAITPGTKLGAYEVQSVLGAGGMGEVYRARDTRLERTVAIKVLPLHLSQSPEAKERFEREARAISCLNHARICTLYDVGHQDGTSYLVMEFLDGETLAERLKRGAVPLKESLKIGIEICEALEIAHRQGVVHRDVKPGNIMLTKSGAKLMDFGLAKPLAVATSGSGSGAPPSFTAAAMTSPGTNPISPLTTVGTIVGTVQYMAPEQIEGKEADPRSDIFSLGSVLYEMVAGKRPFEGKSQISLASAILEKDPEPISALKPLTPPAFEHTVKTCLQKDPEERFQTAHDVKLELQWVASSSSSTAMAAMPGRPTISRKRERLGWLLALAIVLALGVIAGTLFKAVPPLAPITRTAINPPDKTFFNLVGDSAGPPVLSPDGTAVAFTASKTDGSTAIWVRPMDAVEAHILPGTEDAIFPFWSPDSRSLGFFSDGKLKVIDLNAGSAQVIADAAFGRGGAWGADGVIVYSPETQTPIMRVTATGGTPVAVTTIDRQHHSSHRWPFFLPDGKHFLYVAINHETSKAENDTLYYASVDGKENRALLRSQTNAIYAGGLLMFARGDQLMGQPFDPASGTLSGQAVNVAKGVMNDISTWHMNATAFSDRLLILGSGGSGDWQLLWLDRNGKQLGIAADKLTNLAIAAISPQGDRIAMQLDVGVTDIWVLDLARGVRTRLTFGPTMNSFPIWSPDGKWIVYTSDRHGRAEVYRKPSDGSGPEELLLSDGQISVPTNWTRDGKYLIYMRGPSGAQELWALPLEGERKPHILVPHAANSSVFLGSVSPNGRWITYTSNESGAPEVYVAAFQGQGKWQLSPNGGSFSRWSSDGRQIYYLDPRFNLFSVPVTEIGGALQFGTPQLLVPNWSAPSVFYDVTPDGKKILLDKVSQQVNPTMTVVTNYAAALKKK